MNGALKIFIKQFFVKASKGSVCRVAPLCQVWHVICHLLEIGPDILRECSPPTMCRMLGVTCHESGVSVSRHMSGLVSF